MIDLGIPARGLAFIKRIETLDRYPGSAIYLTDKSRDQISVQQFDILAVGGDERCEDEDCERLHVETEAGLFHWQQVEVGDWVLCRKRSWSATPALDVYVVRQSDILGKFVVT